MGKYIFCFLLIGGIALHAQEKIKWVSMEEAQKIQIENPDKPLFIDIYTEWCGWCKKMDKSTFTNEDVVAFLNEYFIPVKFDAEYKSEIQYKNETFEYIQSGNRGIHELAVALLQGSMSYPSYVVLNSKGQVTHLMKGYMEANDLLNRF